jgi:hypothetical protein
MTVPTVAAIAVIVEVAIVGPMAPARHRIRSETAVPMRMQKGKPIHKPEAGAGTTIRTQIPTRSKMLSQVESALYGDHQLAQSIVDMAVGMQEGVRTLAGPELDEIREYIGMTRRGTWVGKVRMNSRVVNLHPESGILNRV